MAIQEILKKKEEVSTVADHTSFNKNVQKFQTPNNPEYPTYWVVAGMMSGCGFGQLKGIDLIPDDILSEAEFKKWDKFVKLVKKELGSKRLCSCGCGDKSWVNAIGAVICNVRKASKDRRKNMEALGFKRLNEFVNIAHGGPTCKDKYVVYILNTID